MIDLGKRRSVRWVVPGRLAEEQLAASATGAYGSIRSTFNHLVLSDGRYLRRLAGDAPAWVDRPDDADLDELAAQAEEAGQLWERLLSEPVDAEGVVVVDDGALEVRAGVIVAQALHHGNAHREQICAILTNLGIEPPDIQPGSTRGRPGGSGNEPLPADQTTSPCVASPVRVRIGGWPVEAVPVAPRERFWPTFS